MTTNTNKNEESQTKTTNCSGHVEPVVSALTVGGNYNFKHQSERLKYIGKYGAWHQFEKIGEWGVWAEILDEDLHMIEETKAH